MAIALNFKYVDKFIDRDFAAARDKVTKAAEVLKSKTGDGNEFLGWLNPESLNSPQQLLELEAVAGELITCSDVVLVAGIGGSYLGARASLEWLQSPNYNMMNRSSPEIYFVGNNLSPSHLNDILSICEGKRVSVIVISKSGTTTETAVTFRVLKEYLKKRYGKSYNKRIVAITDESRGTLKEMATAEDFKTFVIPDDVGGRFSVLTPVGLLPIAVSKANINDIIAGAQAAKNHLTTAPYEENEALQYAAHRYFLHKKGYAVELYCGWDPCATMTLERLKQLFGESEGKDGKALLPDSVTYSADLHSLGQFVQQGSKILFETMVTFDEDRSNLDMLTADNDGDGLNYLAGKTLNDINKTACEAVCIAHYEGDVPIIKLSTKDRSAFNYGYLLYFFEYTCGIGGYALDVNPFNQPGVEDYKKNMFRLLGKPGYDK